MSNRVKHLDALRGIAVLMVFSEHLINPFSRWVHTPETLKVVAKYYSFSMFNPGRFGVVLFFMLSGYVIPLSFRGKRPYFDFFISRAFRLYPAYWLSVLFTSCVLLWLTTGPGLLQALANLTMLQKIFGQPDLNGVYWSLFVEIIFYAICVILFATGVLTNAKALAAATLLCVTASTLPIMINFLFGSQLPVQFLTHHLSFLFFGGVVRHAIGNSEPTAREPFAIALVAILLSLPFATGLVAHINPAQAGIGYEWGMLAAYVVALATFIGSCLLKKPANSLLVWLGTISYAIYVLHTPCLHLAEAFAGIDSIAQQITYLTLSCFFTLGFSAACYNFVERPGIVAGNRIRFGSKAR